MRGICIINKLRLLLRTSTTAWRYLKKNIFSKTHHRKLRILLSPCRRKMSALDVQDFIQQNRAVAQQVETYRGYWESDKHWEARREFILRNMEDFTAEQLDQLLSLSMVWANNVFMGCRYVNAPRSQY